MKKSFAKFIALALVLIMALGAMPLSVMAEGEGWSWWTDPISGSEPYPEQEFLPPEADDVTVKVHSPEGALPEGTDIKVESADLTAVQAVVDNSANISGTVLAAVDITFTYNNTEVQPNSNVTVNMTSPAFEGQQNLRVVHITQLRSDSVAAEPVAADFEGDTATFKADHFSVYAVIGGELDEIHLLTINFYDKDGTTIINKQKIRIDRIPEMNPVVYDPGVPRLGSNQAFTGWGTAVPGSTYTTGGSVTIEDIIKDIKEQYSSWTTDQELTYYAQVFDVTFVFYCDQYGAIFKTDTVAVGGEVTYDDTYVAEGPSGSKVGLLGWLDYTNINNSNVERVGEGTTLPVYKAGAADEAATRVPGTTGTANGEIVLFPYVAAGHWITFDGNKTYNGNEDPTSPTFTAPRFVANNSAADPVTNPTRDGYTFLGWYTENGTKFNFKGESNPTLVTEDIKLYAHWQANSVSYKIVYWTQNRNDEVNLSANDKTWDYYAPKASDVVVEGTATAGSSFTLPAPTSGKTAYNRLGRNSSTYSGNANNGELGYYFTLNDTMTEKTKLIKGDGTTIFNVYYDRAKLTFNFYSSSSASTPQYTYTGLYEHDFGGYPSLGSGYRWYYDDTNENKTYELSDGTAPSVFKPFLLCSETWDIYRQSYSDYDYNSDIHYMLQDLDGSYYTFRDDTLGYNSSSSYVTMNIGGYEFFGFTGVGYNQTTNSTSTSNGFHGFTAREDKKAYVFNGYQIRTYGTWIYFQRNQWNLDFYSNGTKINDLSAVVYFDKPLSGYEPAANYVPSNAPVGKYFTGWYKDPECTEPFVWTGNMPNNDVAVYAGWTDEYYRVVFQAYDENVPANNVVVRGDNQKLSFCMQYGKKIGAGSLANLECTIPGYVFGGWYFDEAHTIPFNFDTEIGPNLPDAQHPTMDMGYKDLPDSQRQGDCTFNRIDDNNQLTLVTEHWHDQGDENRGVRGKLTLFALWRKKVAGASGVTVIYDAIEDKGIIKAPYPAEVVKPDPLTYTDGAVAFGRYAATPIDAEGVDDETRQFLYWEIRDKEGNVVYKVYPGQPFPIDIDWAVEVESYTITWKIRNAQGEEYTETTKVAEGSIPRHADPSSYISGGYNYVFVGWNPELTAVTGDATYTAQYEKRDIVNHTVTFIHNGTTETQQVVEGAYPTVPTTINTPNGKRFIGWYMNSETTLLSSEEVAAIAITADTTFTAQYEDAGFTVTFDANTCNGTDGYFAATNEKTFVQENVPAGTKLSDLFPSSNPVNSATVSVGGEDEEVSFYGWFTQANGGVEITNQTVTGDITVYAHWCTRSWEYDNSGTFVVGDMYSFDIMNSSSSEGSGYSLGVGTPGSYLRRSSTTSTVTSDQQWTVIQGNTGTLLANASNGSYYYIYSNDGEGYTSTSQAVAISLDGSAGTATYNNSTVRVYYLKSGSAYLNYTASSSYTSWFIWQTTATTKYIVWHYETVDQNASSKAPAAHSADSKAYDDGRSYVAPASETKSGKTVTMRDGTTWEKATSIVDTNKGFEGMNGSAKSGTNPSRAVATYTKVSTLTPGKRYLITYTSGSTAYVMNNTYNNTSNNYQPKATSVAVSSNTITGDYDDYLFGVTYTSNNEYRFGNLSMISYLGMSSDHYANFSGDYPCWTITSEGYLKNAGRAKTTSSSTSTSDQYYMRYVSGSAYFDTYSSATSYSVITFYERVEDAVDSGEDFNVTTDLQVGSKYIIAIDNVALGNQPVNNNGNDYFINAIPVVHTTGSNEHITIASGDVTAATWEIVSGNASSGYVFKNVGNDKYLGMSSDGKYYLAATTQALASSWTYDNGTDLNNHETNSNNATTSNGTTYYYYYLSVSTEFLDFTTSINNGQNVKFYAVPEQVSEDVTYTLVNQPVAGKEYVVVIGTNAVGNTTVTGGHYMSPVTVTDNGDNTITVPASSVSSVLWTVGGSSSGWTFYNTAASKYIGVTSDYYLAPTDTAQNWTYDGTDLNNGIADSGNQNNSGQAYYYLSYATASSTGVNYNRFTTSVNSGNNVKFYGIVETPEPTETPAPTETPEPTNYTVTYMVNGSQHSQVTAANGTSVTLPASITAPEGYTFAGWVSNQIPDETTSVPTYYAAGASYGPVNSDVTLYALFTRSEGGTGTAYELVTSALTDWSGNYVITYGTTESMYVMKGVTPDSGGASIESSANRSTYAASGITLDGSRLTGVADTYVFTMEARGSYYRVQSVATGAYLGLTSSSSSLLAGYTSYSSTYCRWTPGVGDNASSMQNANSSASYRYLSFSTNSNYFWSGSSANTGVRLWKETTDSTTYYTTQTEATYTLTINYVLPTGFETAIENNPEIHHYTEGTHYEINVPEVAHCTPNVTIVSGNMPAQPVTVTVTYTEDPKHTVTVHYTGLPAEANIQDKVVTVYEGEYYTIGSPYYYGYQPDQDVVSGEMGTENIEVTVTYSTIDMGDKTYTITLYAVYGRANTTGDTHIYWYTNDETANENSGGARQEDILGINDPINIPTPTSFVSGTVNHIQTNNSINPNGFSWEDHVFLGWARIEDPTNQDTTGHAHRELNEDNLYLRWDGTTYQVNTKNGWVDVDQVAADEMRPYHDMYAVWADVFYVYHSSNNKVEQVVRTHKSDSFNLTELVPEGSLYGGYYTNYAGKSAGFNAKNMTWNTNIKAADLDANGIYKQNQNDSGTAYDGKNVTWNFGQAYLSTRGENGLAMTPVAGTTYYLKEVPADKYLQPYLHYTYTTADGVIRTAWAISDIDDLCYLDTGFVVVDAQKHASVRKSITIVAENTGATVTLTPDGLFGIGASSGENATANRLTYSEVYREGDSGNVLANGCTVSRYWQTPDGLFVTGTVVTTYDNVDSAWNISAVDNSEVGSQITVGAPAH